MTEWLSSLAAEYADQIEMSLRLCAATIAGMVVGINRDIHDKPIGMRTLGLVSLGSAIVVLAGSVYEGIHFGQDSASRVIQGIMTGLGFLGAGVDPAGPEQDGGSWAHHGGDGLDRCGARRGCGPGSLVRHHRRNDRHPAASDLREAPRRHADPAVLPRARSPPTTDQKVSPSPMTATAAIASHRRLEP